MWNILPRLPAKRTKSWQTPPYVTFSIFTFDNAARGWAFRQMALARPRLWRRPGLRFYKMLGAGQGLVFSLRPDWNRYALLAVWDSRAQAEDFLSCSSFMQHYRRRAATSSSIVLRPVASRGHWDSLNPFWPAASADITAIRPLAVVTRAAINWRRLPAFWRQAAPVSQELEKQAGLLASIGVGEAPFIRQATFSVWQSYEAMQEFAYKSPQHRQTIKRTRQGNWYREDLFARFEILSSQGPFFHQL